MADCNYPADNTDGYCSCQICNSPLYFEVYEIVISINSSEDKFKIELAERVYSRSCVKCCQIHYPK